LFVLFHSRELAQRKQPLLAIYYNKGTSPILVLSQYKLRHGEAKNQRFYDKALPLWLPSISALEAWIQVNISTLQLS